MQSVIPQSVNMTDRQFEKISAWVKELCGINLHTGKKELVKSRLNKRLRQINCAGFDKYIDLVKSDRSGAELTTMLDLLSTNLTFFFRENAHFDYLRQNTIPALLQRQKKASGPIRVWSAGCSSGEEPYSLAITLHETIPDIARKDVKVLATDLSTRVLAHAKRGVYEQQRFKDVPAAILAKYFNCIQPKTPKSYETTPKLRKTIHFARLNLMESWPMQGPFDIIFCRNVMIYFDKTIQARLVNRFHDLLRPGGGALFIGHSESLTGIKHPFQYLCPTVYGKR